MRRIRNVSHFPTNCKNFQLKRVAVVVAASRHLCDVFLLLFQWFFAGAKTLLIATVKFAAASVPNSIPTTLETIKTRVVYFSPFSFMFFFFTLYTLKIHKRAYNYSGELDPGLLCAVNFKCCC